MPKLYPAPRPFFAVYAVTLAAMVFDFWLNFSHAPRHSSYKRYHCLRGCRSRPDGLLFSFKNRISLAAAAFAFANVCLLRQINLLAHLGPPT
jgi:hypothetical protein